MRRIIIVLGFFFLLILLSLAVLFALPSKAQQNPTFNEPNSDKLFSLINKYREQNKLPAFEKNDELCRISDKRSRVEFDSHKGFLAEYSNYPYKIGENITGYIDPYDSFIAWKKSPPHKAAMLSGWKYACVSCNKTCVTIFSSFTK